MCFCFYLQRRVRGAALVDSHISAQTNSQGKDGEEDVDNKIWDHGRDMSLGGRLMDDKNRDRILKEARGLGDRFGAGKAGGWL